MITCDKKYLEQRCKERRYSLEEVMPCVVSQDGDTWTIDTNHPSYPKVSRAFPSPKSSVTLTQSINKGPGTELKKLLKKIGIVASPNCSCNHRAALMDTWGPDECEKRIDEIVVWLREEASKRGLPFIDYAGKILVKRAIKNARKNQ